MPLPSPMSKRRGAEGKPPVEQSPVPRPRMITRSMSAKMNARRRSMSAVPEVERVDPPAQGAPSNRGTGQPSRIPQAPGTTSRRAATGASIAHHPLEPKPWREVWAGEDDEGTGEAGRARAPSASSEDDSASLGHCSEEDQVDEDEDAFHSDDEEFERIRQAEEQERSTHESRLSSPFSLLSLDGDESRSKTASEPASCHREESTRSASSLGSSPMDSMNQSYAHEPWMNKVGESGARLVVAHKRATHKCLELLKLAMELNSAAEEYKDKAASLAYLDDLNETLSQEAEIVDFLRHEIVHFYESRLDGGGTPGAGEEPAAS